MQEVIITDEQRTNDKTTRQTYLQLQLTLAQSSCRFSNVVGSWQTQSGEAGTCSRFACAPLSWPALFSQRDLCVSQNLKHLSAGWMDTAGRIRRLCFQSIRVHLLLYMCFIFSHFCRHKINLIKCSLSLLGRPLWETRGEPPPDVVSGENVTLSSSFITLRWEAIKTMIFLPYFFFPSFFFPSFSSLFILQDTTKIVKIVTPGPTYT